MSTPVPRMHGVTILGATGSIGTQAIDIVRRNPERFLVTGLAASGRDVTLLARQALMTGAPLVAISDEAAAAAFPDALRDAADAANVRFPVVEVLAGTSAPTELAGVPTGVVLNGMAGAAGLPATIAALEAGSVLALANKESLIIGGPVVKRTAGPDQIVPVDSEHSALAQVLRGGAAHEVRRLILTASGGPFRGMGRHELEAVTPERALAHPTWNMGRLVTVNSATMVNKGLELIEAHLLFDVPFDGMEVVVHPQSIVHSMVEFYDGSTLLQASPPDMRLPIALGLAWPERVPDAVPPCDWTDPATWTFEPVDHETFPAVRLAAQVGAAGGVLPAIFNAADEVAVEAFLAGELPFPGIVQTVERVVDEYDGHLNGNELTVRDVLAADGWGRVQARSAISDQR